MDLRKSFPWNVQLSTAAVLLLVFLSWPGRVFPGDGTVTQILPESRLPSQEVASETGVTGKIAYMSSSDRTNWHIMMMDLDGTNQENLSSVLDPAGLCSDIDPHFKPDGSNIVFARRCSGGTVHRLYTMSPDGNTVTGLSPTGVSYSAETPKYSWDGARVVFKKVGTQSRLAYFQVANPSGTLTDIPNTSTQDFWPSFSPDGQWVVFQRMATSQTMKICRIKLDGSSLTVLTDGSHLDEMPYYSPDGQYIVFKRGGNTSEPKTDIYRIDASDGGNPTNLTSSPAALEDAPIYSWEGTYLAYQAISTASTYSQIFLADADGGNVQQLTTNAFYNWNPTFSPASLSQLTVKKSGTGTGTISSKDGKIACGPTCSEASQTYIPGTQVVLSASAESGSTFTGWSGSGCSGTGPCTVKPDTDTTVTAAFALKTYRISGKVKTEAGAGFQAVTVVLTGAGTGSTQTDAGGGFKFSGLSNGAYTVAPGKSGYTFSPVKWSGNISGKDITVPDFTGKAAPSTGGIKATITPSGAVNAGAKWRVDGGTWRAGGTTASDLSVGTHTVSFKPVSGWKTPADQKVPVTGGVVTNTAGKYVQQGSLKVTITPSAAVKAGAKWKVDGGSWRAGGTTVSNLNAGKHTVSFKPVSGWKTPSSQKVSVASGKTTAVSAKYTK